jgi:hypothetical protein
MIFQASREWQVLRVEFSAILSVAGDVVIDGRSHEQRAGYLPRSTYGQPHRGAEPHWRDLNVSGDAKWMVGATGAALKNVAWFGMLRQGNAAIVGGLSDDSLL